MSLRDLLVLSGLVAGLLCAAAPGPALAQSSGCADEKEAIAAGNEVRAWIDPETGELMEGPPAGQADSPASASAQPEEPQYETKVRPDGTVALDLSGRPPEQLRAEQVDGKTVFCHRPGSVPPAPPEN